MKIIRLEKVESTHKYLKEHIKTNGFNGSLCVVTSNQTNGIGSRGNSWQGEKGNLFFSFVIEKSELPKDLPLQSTSIYFSFILRSVLKSFGSKVWLKWPNDFYIDNKKIGGTITSMSSDLIYCGIGLNIVNVQQQFGKLDISIEKDLLLESYLDELKKTISWKQIFSKFRVEFKLSKKFYATVNNQKVTLQNAILNDDGSVYLNNEKVFSLR
ncbi:MAG: biotin--[acetyl-CoA-carboxylase] ligase [Campylobacterota bacterium]